MSIRARLILLVLAVVLPAAGLVAWMFIYDSRDAQLVALVGLAVFLAALALAYRIAAAIVKPISALARTSIKVANGELTARAYRRTNRA